MKNSSAQTIGVVVVTLNAAKHLPHCLPPILASPLKPRLLILDSSSDDDTCKIAASMGAETFVIPRSAFNHGVTRELGRKLLGSDIAVMMTQDAYAVDSSFLEHLVRPIQENRAALSYARQIAHDGASFFEAFPRRFNYPAHSHLRSDSDRCRYGVYTYFCSDSCAAYSKVLLDAVGGFPEVLFGEDTLVAAALLKHGHSIAYVAEAVVKHSHSYTLKEELCRCFDIGLVRKGYTHLLETGDTDTKRGGSYAKELLKELTYTAPHLLPYGFLHLFAKWIGYQLGRYSVDAPLWWKKIWSHQKFYWKDS